MSEKRRPLGRGPKAKPNGNIKNYLKHEINSLILKFEKKGLGTIKVSKKPEKVGNEYLFKAEKDTDKKIFIYGKSPCEFHAKRKLFDKLIAYLKDKSEICEKPDKRKKIYEEIAKKEVSAANRVDQARLYIETAGHTFY